MVKNSNFLKKFKRLNKNQRIAVGKIEGPVMVVAGPGTGKTTVLTLRIANILRETDVSPDSILALTFTEAATREMKERLIDLIGKDGYRIRVGTFHSFCQEVIMDNPEKFLIGEGGDNLSDLERNEIVQKILLTGSFETIKPTGSPLFFATAILSAIRNLKREGINPEEFETILIKIERQFEREKGEIKKTDKVKREKELAKNHELATVYRLYQKELVKRSRFDFEDMINWVIDAFKKDDDFLLKYQEKFNYILVDEYQDTNTAQNEIVFLLSSYWGKSANVFVVGDPNQSIFRFQGASIENVQEFVKRFPNLTLINLTKNYRSSQLILDVAHEVIVNNKNQLSQLEKTALVAETTKENPPIEIGFFSRGIYEDFFVTEKIKAEKKAGLAFSEMAVIARQNQDLKELAHYLKRTEIPVVIEGGEDILKTSVVKKIIKLLRTIDQIDSGSPDTQLFDLLYEDFWGLTGLEIVRFLRQANDKKTGLVANLLETDKESKFYKLACDLSRWKKEEKNLTFPEFFSKVIEDSGLLRYVLDQKDKLVHLSRMNSLFNEIKRQTNQNHKLNLTSFLQNIDLMEKQNIMILEEAIKTVPEAVTLTTVHKAKGREWKSVFIYRFVDGRWGNNRNWELIKLPTEILEFGNKSYDPNEEERRLFYVALTRAIKQVTISGAVNYESVYGNKEGLPASFLEEIDKEKINRTKTDWIEDKAQKALEIAFAKKPRETTVTGEAEYLKELTANFKMSVTALNTYLTCPYKFKLNNLYRIPKAKEEYLSFGTAVHRALELFHQKFIKDKSVPRKEFLLKEFEKALEKEVLTDEGFARRKKQGQKNLSAYYDFYESSFKKSLATEKYFGYSSYSGVLLDDIPLIGKVDRVEIVDKNEGTVRVIDYKTGKPKSRNEIEGKTKNSDGSYKRQLVFYQILTDLDNSFKPKMVEAELDFIEPNERGVFCKEQFVISKKEVAELKEIIKQTTREIRSLKFQRTNDYSKCIGCDFFDHCWPEGVPKTSGQNNQDN